MSRRDSLAAVPLFAGLSATELEQVAKHAHTREAPPGEEIIREGDPGDEFFVVIEGALDILIGGRRVNVMGPGDFFGELALLFREPRSATAVTTEDTTMLVLGSSDFELVLRAHPNVEAKVFSVVSQRMRYR